MFNVEWRKIYDLDSQFHSLLKIEIQELENLLHSTQSKAEQKALRDKLQLTKTQHSITLRTLLDFGQIKQDRFDDCVDRILAGFSLDFENPNARVDFETFGKIKCFL